MAYGARLGLAVYDGDQALVLPNRVLEFDSTHFRDDGVGTDDEHERVCLVDGQADLGEPLVNRGNAFPIHPRFAPTLLDRVVEPTNKGDILSCIRDEDLFHFVSTFVGPSVVTNVFSILRYYMLDSQVFSC